MQVYANLPLPLAAALDVEPGEAVTWKVLDRTHLLLVRLPERKKLKGEAVPRLQARKKARRGVVNPDGRGWAIAAEGGGETERAACRARGRD